MYLHPSTGILTKRITLNGKKVNAIIDTGASDIFISTKLFKLLEPHLSYYGEVEERSHTEVGIADSFIAKETLLIDGNSAKGLLIVVRSNHHFKGTFCSVILGTSYLKTFLNRIQL